MSTENLLHGLVERQFAFQLFENVRGDIIGAGALTTFQDRAFLVEHRPEHSAWMALGAIPRLLGGPPLDSLTVHLKQTLPFIDEGHHIPVFAIE